MIVLVGIAVVVAVAGAGLTAFVYLAPGKVTEVALGGARRQAGLVRKTVTLAGGLRCVYLEGGVGEPLMLLHGFGGNKDTFTRVARFLAKRYRVIIPDITGFGESDRPEEADYSLPAQVERLRAFSRALRLQGLHLGGNSMGAQMALLYSARYPDEIRSLWLLSPSGVWSAPESEALRHYRQTGRNLLLARNEQEFRDVMSLGMSRPPRVPGPILNVLAEERIRNVELEQRIFPHILDHAVENEVRGMETPALVVFGDRDCVIPLETATILKELLPRSTVALVPGAGHVTMLEKPRECARDYLAFRESVS